MKRHCSNWNLQNIENYEPDNAVPSTSPPITNVVKPSNRQTILILPHHQSTPLIPSPPLNISPISPSCLQILVPSQRHYFPYDLSTFWRNCGKLHSYSLLSNPRILNAVNFAGGSLTGKNVVEDGKSFVMDLRGQIREGLLGCAHI